MLFYFRLLAHADNTDLYFYIWCFFWSVRIVGSLCGPDRWFSATLGGPGGRNGVWQPPPSSIVSSSSSVVSLLRDFVVFDFLASWFRVSLAACSVLSLSVSVYFVWCSMTEKHFGSPPHVFMCAVKTLPDVLSTCTIGVVSIQRSLPVYLFLFSISLFIFLHMMLFNFTVFWLWNQTKYLNPTPPSFQTSSAAYSVFPSLRASWHQENKLSVHLFPYFTEYNKSEDLSLTHARFLHISPVYMILEYLSQ